jgi:hypothetical protein
MHVKLGNQVFENTSVGPFWIQTSLHLPHRVCSQNVVLNVSRPYFSVGCWVMYQSNIILHQHLLGGCPNFVWLRSTILIVGWSVGRTRKNHAKCYAVPRKLFCNFYILLLQSVLQPLVGFRPAQLTLSILSRKVLLSAVASGTSNPKFGGEPGI